MAVAKPAFAADPGATAFVTAIYAAYKGKNAKGIRLDTEANIRRYFEPKLAALMIKDQKDAARRHDAPNLDGDAGSACVLRYRHQPCCLLWDGKHQHPELVLRRSIPRLRPPL